MRNKLEFLLNQTKLLKNYVKRLIIESDEIYLVVDIKDIPADSQKNAWNEIYEIEKKLNIPVFTYSTELAQDEGVEYNSSRIIGNVKYANERKQRDVNSIFVASHFWSVRTNQKMSQMKTDYYENYQEACT